MPSVNVWSAAGTASGFGEPVATVDVEVQTATAAQTVFTLTTLSYTPGEQNLSVYVNGVRQNASEYTETSSTVVTFGVGIDLSDEVTFVINDFSADPLITLTPTTATTAGLASISDTVNTSALKVAGFQVFNTTTSKPVWAVGAADGDAWVDATGATVHTPV